MRCDVELLCGSVQQWYSNWVEILGPRLWTNEGEVIFYSLLRNDVLWASLIDGWQSDYSIMVVECPAQDTLRRTRHPYRVLLTFQRSRLRRLMSSRI